MNDYLLSLISTHVELTSAQIIDKMTSDLEARDLLARYASDRDRKEAIRKALGYLRLKGVALSTQEDGINYWRAAPQTTPPQNHDASHHANHHATMDQQEAQAETQTPAPSQAQASHHDLEHALLNPIKGQIPADQAHRWSRVCEALAASPLLHDSLARELDDISHHFRNQIHATAA